MLAWSSLSRLARGLRQHESRGWDCVSRTASRAIAAFEPSPLLPPSSIRPQPCADPFPSPAPPSFERHVAPTRALGRNTDMGSASAPVDGPRVTQSADGSHVAPASTTFGSTFASPRHPTDPHPNARLLSSGVYHVGSSTNIKWHETKVDKDVRQGLLKQRGCVIWFTGLSGSGKSTLAYTLEHALVERGHLAYVLDGDNVRHGLNKNLGFSAEDREENIRRVGEVGKLFADAGIITIISFISPYRRDRLAARALVPEGDFIEVYMKIPLSVCEERDPKGLYKMARAGKIKGFTGIDDPYEEPDNAEVVIEVSKEDGVLQPPEKMAQTLLGYLETKGIFVEPSQ